MNYFGSKSRQAKYIVPIIQKYINENNIEVYIEPFVGGANIADKIVCRTIIPKAVPKSTEKLFVHKDRVKWVT